MLVRCNALRCMHSLSRKRSLSKEWKMLNSTTEAAAMKMRWMSSSSSRELLVLGIESTCDESGVALVSSRSGVLCNLVASQFETHAPFGSGVVPMLAAREHEKALPVLLERVLEECKGRSVHAVAVAAGPGLAPCLDVGVRTATELANQLNVPLYAVNHLEAHSLVAHMTDEQVQFPHLTLLLSGGHSELWHARKLSDYLVLGNTLDDAVGEAFDKCAIVMGVDERKLRIEEPLGAVIERLAASGDATRFLASLPRPLHARPGFDFSLSGLKTAFRLSFHQEMGRLEEEKGGEDGYEEAKSQLIADFCASFQHRVADHVSTRLRRALQWANKDETVAGQMDTVVFAGGVATNKFLRKEFDKVCQREGFRLKCPDAAYCGDNGVMIAYVGVQKMIANHATVSSALGFNPRWAVGAKQKFVTSAKPRLFS